MTQIPPAIPLRHGAFLPPFHPMNENPAACIDRDLELMQWLDRLGFNEAIQPLQQFEIASASTRPGSVSIIRPAGN